MHLLMLLDILIDISVYLFAAFITHSFRKPHIINFIMSQIVIMQKVDADILISKSRTKQKESIMKLHFGIFIY